MYDVFFVSASIQHQHCLVGRDVYDTQTMSLHFYAVSGTSSLFGGEAKRALT